MLMRHEIHGWANVLSTEVAEMVKNGWIESSENERQKIIATKLGADIINSQVIAKGKPGRKPKNLTDGLGNEHSANPD